MTIELSDRSSQISQSEIRAMSIACREKGGINLSQGVCDTETPASVLEGAKESINNGHNSYTQHTGITPLREAIAQKEKILKEVVIDPDTEIVVSSGATGALYSALLATLNPNEEVIVFEPYYGYHVSTLLSLDIKINYVRLEEPDWHFTKEMVEEKITPQTKAILINTPGNPSGKVMSREELLLLGEIAETHNLILFSDEIYEYFVYGSKKHLSPISIPELRERTIVIGGFSKTFSITGWRVGYTIAPKHISEAIGHVSDLVYVCAPAPLQGGVAKGIETLEKEHYKELCDDHLLKREKICSALSEAGFTPMIPDGAYYVLADLSSIKANTSRERALQFLDETGVAGVAGSAFYHDNSGDHLCRFCYAKEMSVIEEACQRILDFGKRLHTKNS